MNSKKYIFLVLIPYIIIPQASFKRLQALHEELVEDHRQLIAKVKKEFGGSAEGVCY